MSTRWTVGILFVSALSSSANLMAGTVSTLPAYQIVSSTTTIPAGQFAGQKFNALSAPMFNQGYAVFLDPPGASSAYNGVYTGYDGGPVQLLADPTTARPGGGSAFQDFRYPSTFGGEFAFSSFDGIYATVHGTLTTVVGPGNSISATSGPSYAGSDVWFYGRNPGDGVFEYSSGIVKQVAAVGNATPGHPGYQFNVLNSNVAGGNGGVAFYGDSGPTANSYQLTGVYTYSAALGARRVADSSMTAPNTTGTFTNFSNLAFANDGQTVVFSATDSVRGNQIDAAQNGVLQTVAFDGERDPSGNTLTVSGQNSYSVYGGTVAFLASTSAGSTIYTEPFGAPMNRVIGVGDTFFGSQITGLTMSDEAYSDNQIAFMASLSNGTTGLYVVTVPEPSILCVGAVSVLALQRGRRRVTSVDRRPT